MEPAGPFEPAESELDSSEAEASEDIPGASEPAFGFRAGEGFLSEDDDEQAARFLETFATWLDLDVDGAHGLGEYGYEHALTVGKQRPLPCPLRLHVFDISGVLSSSVLWRRGALRRRTARSACCGRAAAE